MRRPDRRPPAEARSFHLRETAPVPHDEAVTDAGRRRSPGSIAGPRRGRGAEGALSTQDRAPIRWRKGLRAAPQGIRLPKHPPRVSLSQRPEGDLQRTACRVAVAHPPPARLGDRRGDCRNVPGSVVEVERGPCGLAAVLRAGRVGIRAGRGRTGRSRRPGIDCLARGRGSGRPRSACKSSRSSKRSAASWS